MPGTFHIQLEQIGKQFYQRWLFRELSFDSRETRRLALIGHNGSGKSTLLRIVAGQMNPSLGRVTYTADNQRVPTYHFYQHISWAAPYVDLFPDLSLREHLRLHFRFKGCRLAQTEDIAEVLDLQDHLDKKFRFYSSGMLQRVKVGTALFSESDLLLLDEPTANMDSGNAARMLDLIDTHIGERVLVLASNLEREYRDIPAQIILGKA
ncbi:MAG: ATP-binding cassette domain-containing protein [Bacteroidetes bacterium]|nr:MAG: ATP-binding cassette domain-containing protein [Bacteroidota bacterium]